MRIPTYWPLVVMSALFGAPVFAQTGADCDANGVDDHLEIRRIDWSGGVVVGTVPDVNDLVSGDLDGDSQVDVVVVSDERIEVIWSAADPLLRRRTSIAFGLFNDGLALADTDGDGDLDIVLDTARTGAAGIWILENLGGRTLRLPTAPTVPVRRRIASVGDFNGDARPDILTASPDVRLHLNDGAGGFDSLGAIPGSVNGRAVATADIDGDGDLDVALALVEATAASVRIYANDGTGEFELWRTIELPAYAGSLASADLDGDGRVDLVVSSRVSQVTSVYLAFQRSEGEFFIEELPSPGFGESVAVGDTNGDGSPEIAIGGGSSFKLFVNRGNGTFDEEAESAVPYELLRATDIDGDGFGDIVGRSLSSVVYLRGDGAEGLLYPRAYSTLGRANDLRAADLDDDGDIDIVVRNTSLTNRSQLVALTNDGTGSLSVVYSTAFMPCDFAPGDLDGDGLSEIVVSHDSGLEIYRAPDSQLEYQKSTLASAGTCGKISVADFDGDSDLDVAVGSTLQVFENTGTSFAAPRVVAPLGFHRARAADLDGDGTPDLVSLTETVQHDDFLTTYRNLGDLDFSPAGDTPLSSRPSDFVTATSMATATWMWRFWSPIGSPLDTIAATAGWTFVGRTM